MARHPAPTDVRLRRARAASQLLDHRRRMGPAALVVHLVGVQAQVLQAAGLALRARADRLTEVSVARSRTADRSIVLTWAMRGTLYLVAAEDYGRFAPLLTEPHVARSLRRLRQEGMNSDRADQAIGTIDQMLEREGPLTRAEIAERLRRRGVPTQGQTIAHLVWLAAAKRRLCFGPDRDGQLTVVRVRDWLGASEPVEREDALVDLAVRYLRSHAPATPEDLAAWSGLRTGDAKRAWAAIADRLVEVPTAAGTMWSLRPGVRAGRRIPVRLLPAFDEYLMGWKDRSFAVPADQRQRINAGGGWLHPVAVHDGLVVATWKLERGGRPADLEVRPFGSTSTAFRTAAASEARDVERYLKTTLRLRFGSA
jgi:winged helix DNA-binding protein